MPKTLRVIGNVLLYIVVGLVLVSAVGTVILKHPFLLAPIRSDSMYPLFERGDVVFIRSADGTDAAVGDIIVFHPEGGSLAGQGFVMHRIVGGTAAEGFITKGDANERTDQEDGTSLVKAGAISARAITIAGRPLRIRLLGYLSLWMEQFQKSPYALPGCMGAVALVLIITELKDRGKQKRKNQSTPAYVVYPAAGLAICLMLGAAQIAASSFPTLQYEVSATGRGVLIGSAVGVLQQGDVFTRDISEIGGNGFLPMVASISTHDSQLTFNKDLVVTRPGTKEKISVTVHARQVGEYQSKVSIGMFLPTLPPVLIHELAQKSYWLALGAVSLVPGLPLILWPVVAPRLRRLMARATRKRIAKVSQRIIP
ncbi:MAG: signal peptidase I [Peptococcaceae bacterium]|nr:signal peptidase I [Peptococcaceae bacterium]